MLEIEKEKQHNLFHFKCLGKEMGKQKEIQTWALWYTTVGTHSEKAHVQIQAGSLCILF